MTGSALATHGPLYARTVNSSALNFCTASSFFINDSSSAFTASIMTRGAFTFLMTNTHIRRLPAPMCRHFLATTQNTRFLYIRTTFVYYLHVIHSFLVVQCTYMAKSRGLGLTQAQDLMSLSLKSQAWLSGRARLAHHNSAYFSTAEPEDIATCAAELLPLCERHALQTFNRK